MVVCVSEQPIVAGKQSALLHNLASSTPLSAHTQVPSWPVNGFSLSQEALTPKNNLVKATSLQNLSYQPSRLSNKGLGSAMGLLEMPLNLTGIDSSQGVATVLQDRIDSQNKVLYNFL